MRVLLLLVAFSGCFAAADSMVDSPVSSPDAAVAAHFAEIDTSTNRDLGTKLTIKNRNGKVLFSDASTFSHRIVQGARWTEDSKYLIMTTVSGGGHSPWHHPVYIFSLSERQLRRLDDSESHPIISTEIWCQPPDTVILVGHDFSHNISAPDDPILLRYKLSNLWPKLK